MERSVPCGWRGIRADFDHYCKVHGAEDLRSRLWVLFASRSFWALALYRFGRFVYARPGAWPLRALYSALFEIVRIVTKTSLSVRSRIEEEVWIAPQGEVFVSFGTRVGRGARLYGGNTLGVGGRAGARGHPSVGEHAVLCPGAGAVGPAQIPDGAVIGPNTLVGRPLPRAGFWLGVPPRPATADQARVPAPRSLHAQPAEANMKPEPFRSAFRADLDRHLVYHPGASAARKLRIMMVSDGIWAMAVYRFGRYLRTREPRALSWFVFRSLEIALGILTSISIDVDALIEPGFYVGHFVSVRIGAGVRIGRNCSVGQMCTLEGQGPFARERAPVLGERVYLGSGCKVIGPVNIGDGAAICANSVVVTDVPENGVVLGNPGVVISRRGSGDFIYLGEGAGVRDELPSLAGQGAG